MRILTKSRLKAFWEDPDNANAEQPLRAWYQVVQSVDWKNPADVRATYNTVDFVGNKVVFDIGGNKYRLIVVIDYEGHKVFIRHVLRHKEYDEGLWKQDTFGEGWTKRGSRRSARGTEDGQKGRRRRPRRKK
jgi:mRNA interferase HigB